MRICRYLHPETKRPALGVLSDGDWIVPLDSDDALFPDMDSWLSDPDALPRAADAARSALDRLPLTAGRMDTFRLDPPSRQPPTPARPVDLSALTRSPGQPLPPSGDPAVAADPPRRLDPFQGGRIPQFPQALLQEPVRPLAPVQSQEVWGAGVTYDRSKVARMEESLSGGGFYDLVYTAERPEIFFKATPRRMVAPGDPIRLRRDSTWDVPEPELVLVVSASGRIVGYSIGNDVSSRSIESENPLYLPQAKTYDGCCSIGPAILLGAEDVDPRDMTIRLVIQRRGSTAFEGEVSTSRMHRSPEELVEYLFRDNSFPDGVLLLTGTGIVPPDEFTLQPGDRVEITIDPIGTLVNPVGIRG